MRGLFEITLRRGWSTMAARMLTLCKCVDHRQWGFEHPLRQFGRLPLELVEKLEARKATLDRLKDMSAEEIGGRWGWGGRRLEVGQVEAPRAGRGPQGSGK